MRTHRESRRTLLPVISRFYGIVIRMFFADHAPPHFHASYGEDELVVGISPIRILEGRASKRVQSMVMEWTALHQEELLQDWELCRNAQAPRSIDPLD